MTKIFFILAILFSSQAFSMRAYYEESCTLAKSNSQLIFYKQDYFLGSHLIIHTDVPGMGLNPTIYLPGSEVSKTDAILGNEDIIFRDIKDSNIEREEYSDGCWQGFSVNLERSAVIEKINPILQNYLGVKIGDIVLLDCGYQNLEPLGEQCDRSSHFGNNYFISKGGSQKYLAENTLMLIAPDTSPRGLNLPGEHETYDFGSGAGFYLNATVAPYSDHYRMYDYIVDELYQIIGEHFKVKNISISGHSMGGHGALVLELRNSTKFKSISVFSPIVNPSLSPWGKKLLRDFLEKTLQIGTSMMQQRWSLTIIYIQIRFLLIKEQMMNIC